MRRVWRDHSWTIRLLGIGAVLVPVSALCPPGWWRDFTLAIGTGAWVLAGGYLLAGFSHERNKIED